MSFSILDLQNSLKGLPYLGNYSGFPLQPSDWNRYIVSEQILSFNVFGLKPGTVHRAYLNGIDVTSLCKQQGKPIGSGLATPTTSDPMAVQGLSFVYYFRAGEAAKTSVEQSAAFSILVGGVRTLEIKSPDGASTAKVQLNLPQYALSEVEQVIKKTSSPDPSVIASTVSYVDVAGSVSDTNYYFTPPNFSMVQSFYADPDIVGGASELTLTSIDLFFKLKPSQTSNMSGNPNAGVAVAICDVENDQPNLEKCYAYSLSYKDYSRIYSFGDASSATTFGFHQPLKLPTGRFYGIVVMYEDPGYVAWVNKTGDRLVNTNIPSPGVNSNKDGKLYFRNNSGTYNSMSDTDIKFVLRCAKYIAQSDKKIFVDRNYEYLTVDTTQGSFLGGEYVWMNNGPSVGSVSVRQMGNTISGTGTSFGTLTQGQNIVLASGANSQVVTVSEVVNNTFIAVSELIEFSNTSSSFYNTAVGRVYKQDAVRGKLYLADSTANTTIAVFTPNSIIVGADSNASANIASVDNLSLDRIRLKGSVRSPANGLIETTLKLTVKDQDGNFVYDEGNAERVKINNVQAYNVTDYDAYLLSRSNEIQQTQLYSNSDLFVDSKSIKVEADYVVLGTGEIFMSPQLDGSKLDLFSIENRVSNTCDTYVGGVVIDSEVAGNGLALSKHITTKVQFSNDKHAEDVRMYMVAYRPKGTEIRCYSRVHNSKDPEAFDDKAWTPLEYVQNAGRYSSYDDENDFIEFELGLPAFSDTANTLPGTFTTTFGGTTIAAANSGVTGITSYVANNDVIKIYNPLFPFDNYQVATVKEANTTHIVLGSGIETNNIAGSGYKVDKLKYPNVAFNNVNNNNISRYYNSALAEFDSFDSMQVKVVFLADSTYKVPRIDQIQVLGVSA